MAVNSNDPTAIMMILMALIGASIILAVSIREGLLAIASAIDRLGKE